MILTTQGAILVVANKRAARLVPYTKRRPVDAVDVAQVSIASYDDVTSSELDQ